MSSKFNTITQLALGLLLMASFAIAQNSPQDYVDAHNAARRDVGVGPVSFDSSVAAVAQSYANQRAQDCRLQHSGNSRYGENIAYGGGNGFDFTIRDAIGLFVSERQYYNYNSNTCASGQQCGHYTQIVWRNSVRIGCGRARCASGQWFIVCNYSPPGNYVGQRPY